MTIVGEVITVWTTTGLSVITMKVAEKMGHSIPHWLPKVTLYTMFTGSVLYLLRYLLFAFL
ncbi:hypothetical protein [Bacillus sp. GB_SG_008]|uniref:hypothetical protein n=1 Tax=Bacillus sp. GB_SG_008 TaxID=3454627 RepID=UPI003F833248